MQSNYQSERISYNASNQRLEFTDSVQSEGFKNKVCLPYFKDIYKDLCSRSNDKTKGINKITMLEYTQLPGVLAERFFHVIDIDKNGYLDQREFMTGLMRFFASPFDQKIHFVFDLYDFDEDGFITKNDILTLINCMPVAKENNFLQSEGKFTQEGGGASNF